jgi:hypothetical protein
MSYGKWSVTNGISWDISREHDMGCNWKIWEHHLYNDLMGFIKENN